jgi:hypothetical protein
MLVGVVVSVWLFSNQVQYTGPLPKHFAWLGDLTFEAGFLITAALYFALFRLQNDRTDEVLVIPD